MFLLQPLPLLLIQSLCHVASLIHWHRKVGNINRERRNMCALAQKNAPALLLTRSHHAVPDSTYEQCNKFIILSESKVHVVFTADNTLQLSHVRSHMTMHEMQDHSFTYLILRRWCQAAAGYSSKGEAGKSRLRHDCSEKGFEARTHPLQYKSKTFFALRSLINAKRPFSRQCRVRLQSRESGFAGPNMETHCFARY